MVAHSRPRFTKFCDMVLACLQEFQKVGKSISAPRVQGLSVACDGLVGVQAPFDVSARKVRVRDVSLSQVTGKTTLPTEGSVYRTR